MLPRIEPTPVVWSEYLQFHRSSTYSYRRARATSVVVMRVGRAAAIVLFVGCGDAEELATASFELLADAAPGEHALVDGIGVVVPERGVGLFLEVMYEDGATHVLALMTRES